MLEFGIFPFTTGAEKVALLAFVYRRPGSTWCSDVAVSLIDGIIGTSMAFRCKQD